MPCRLVTKISFSSSTCKWKRGPMFWINLLQVSISLAPGPPMLAFTLSCNLLPIYRTRLRENNNKKETFSWLCSIEPLGVQWPASVYIISRVSSPSASKSYAEGHDVKSSMAKLGVWIGLGQHSMARRSLCRQPSGRIGLLRIVFRIPWCLMDVNPIPSTDVDPIPSLPNMVDQIYISVWSLLQQERFHSWHFTSGEQLLVSGFSAVQGLQTTQKHWRSTVSWKSRESRRPRRMVAEVTAC